MACAHLLICLSVAKYCQIKSHSVVWLSELSTYSCTTEQHSVNLAMHRASVVWCAAYVVLFLVVCFPVSGFSWNIKKWCFKGCSWNVEWWFPFMLYSFIRCSVIYNIWQFDWWHPISDPPTSVNGLSLAAIVNDMPFVGRTFYFSLNLFYLLVKIWSRLFTSCLNWIGVIHIVNKKRWILEMTSDNMEKSLSSLQKCKVTLLRYGVQSRWWTV